MTRRGDEVTYEEAATRSPVSLFGAAFESLSNDNPNATGLLDLDKIEERYARIFIDFAKQKCPEPWTWTQKPLPNEDHKAWMAKLGIKKFSFLWYCMMICEIIPKLRRAIERGDTKAVFNYSVLLGFHIADSTVHIANRETVNLGSKLAPRLASGRGTANAQRKAMAAIEHGRWIATARKVWKRSPRHSVTSCARIVIKDLGLSAKLKTVADVIRSQKKVGEAS